MSNKTKELPMYPVGGLVTVQDFELKAKYDALAARVAILRQAINENCFGPCHEPDGSVGVDGYPWAFKVLSETEDSTFCLAAHDAEVAAKAIEDSWSALSSSFDFGIYGARLGLVDDLDTFFSKYAAQLRAKAGKS